MLPQSQPRKKRNSSKVNLIISFTFHATIVLTLLYFAAREGLLGTQLKKIAVQMVREKQAEKPKEPEKSKDEPPKQELPKVAETPKVETPRVEAPPAAVGAPMAAPPPTDLPSFVFEGGKTVETSSDSGEIYKGFVEYALRSRWNRPDNLADDGYVAEVEVSVDRSGQISNPSWKKSSGDKLWDDSVRKAIAAVKSLDRPPPTNFPSRIIVRFDVQQATGPIFQ